MKSIRTRQAIAIVLSMSSTAIAASPLAAQPMPPGGGQRASPMASFISPVGKPYRVPKEEPYAIVTWFQAIDTGQKGYLTATDFEREAIAFFAELDISKDGEITPEEMTRYEQEVAPETQAGLGGPPGMSGGMPSGKPPGGPPGGGGPPGEMGGGPPGGKAKRFSEMPKGAGMFGIIAAPQPVASADANFDRSVTLAELRNAARRRFVMLDANNTGRLILADLPRTPIEKMMGLKR